MSSSILVVDLIDNSRQFLAQVLRAANYSVLEAESPEAANALAEENDIALLIFNDHGDGEYLDALLSRALTGPVVLITDGWTESALHERFEDVNGNAVILSAPVIPTLLLPQIDFLLPGSGKTEAVVPGPVHDPDALREIGHEHDDDPLSLIDRKPVYEPMTSSKKPGTVKKKEYVLKSNKRIGSLIKPSESIDVEAPIAPVDAPQKKRVEHKFDPIDDKTLRQLAMYREKLDIERQLQSARVFFARELPGRLEDLAGGFFDFRQDTKNRDLYDAISDEVHRLRGQATAMGFNMLADCIKRLEELMQMMQRKQARPETELWEDLIAALKACDDAAESEAQSESTEDRLIVQRGIMLVGDESTTSVLLEAIEDFDFRPTVASSLEEAVSLLDETSVDAVLVSVGESGDADLAEWIVQMRSIAGYDWLPVGVFSGAEQEAEKALYAGADICLPYLDVEAAAYVAYTLMDIATPSTARALIACSDEHLAGYLRRVLLEIDCHSKLVSDPYMVARAISSYEPDLVLVDTHVGSGSGFDVIRSIRALKKRDKLPVFLLTDKNSFEAGNIVTACGATSSFIKPLFSEELRSNFGAVLHKSQHLKLRRKRDEATQFMLPSGFENEVARFMSASETSVVSLLIPGLKKLVSRHGAAAAEVVILKLSQLIQERFRSIDLRARFSDDNFMIAFPDCSKNIVSKAVQLLKEEFESVSFVPESRKVFHASLIFSVVQSPIDGDNAGALIDKAHDSMMEPSR